MNKFAFILIVGMVVVSGVLAQEDENLGFSEAEGFQWLYDELNASGWNEDTRDVAISILALRQGNFPVQAGVDELLKTRTGSDWNGDLEDTAYATFALYMTGHDVTNETEWLKEQATKGNGDGGWLLQIRSNFNGSCVLEYNEGIEKTVDVVDNIITCDGVSGSKISLSSCIGVLDAYEPITVNCNNLPGAGTTLLYQGQSGYYLLEEVSGIKGPMNILNNMYGSYEATGIVNWVLKEVGRLDEGNSSKHYIETNVNPGRDLDYGYAFQATGDILYSNVLTDEVTGRQNPSGSWSEDVFVTSYIYMLTKDSKAKTWLENEQSTDGSWDSEVFETAWALFVLSPRMAPSTPKTCVVDGICGVGEDSFNCPLDCTGNVTAENCTNRQDDDGDFLVDCDDVLDCRTNLACANVTPSLVEICDNKLDDDGDFLKDCDDTDCALDPYCAPPAGAECVVDSDCGAGMVCKEGLCFSADIPDPVVDPVEESNFWLWFFLILLILAIGVAGFFAYKKFKGGGGGKKQQSFDDFLKGEKTTPQQPVRQQPVQQQRPVKSAYGTRERELDESIRKAKEMLRKK